MHDLSLAVPHDHDMLVIFIEPVKQLLAWRRARFLLEQVSPADQYLTAGFLLQALLVGASWSDY